MLTHGGDEDEAIAALLHDAVEDQGGTAALRDIRRKFGDRVAHIVEGCTDADTDPKPPWLERKKSYLRHLRSARIVRAAGFGGGQTLQRERNPLRLSKHRDSVWDRFKGGKQGTLWYYREVAKILRGNGPQELVTELDRVVGELQEASRDT